MQAKRIIPCLDVDDGRVVKGIKFKGIQDAGDPVELARRYNDDGADELTFLDIGASYKSRATLLDVVRKVAAEVFIPLCVGGGIRTVEDMREAMNAGADKVSVCTSALQNPQLLSEMAKAYGSQCVVLSIDAARVKTDATEKPRWTAFSHGGRTDTGIDAIEWAIRAVELGVGEILLNSIDADGTGDGYDLELTQAILEAVPVPVIASGGAGDLDQIANVLLSTKGAVTPSGRMTASTIISSRSCSIGEANGADAALVASLLHFGKTTIREIKKHAESKGVCVRW
jgi:cyclase